MTKLTLLGTLAKSAPPGKLVSADSCITIAAVVILMSAIVCTYTSLGHRLESSLDIMQAELKAEIQIMRVELKAEIQALRFALRTGDLPPDDMTARIIVSHSAKGE